MPAKTQKPKATPAKVEEQKPETPAPKTDVKSVAKKQTKKVEKPVENPSETATVEGGDAPVEPGVEDRFKTVLGALDELGVQLKSLRQDISKLHKRANLEIKEATKRAGRRRRAPATKLDENGNPIENKPVSGIVKPTNVSNEMCEFMKQPNGTLLARTEVTKYITGYISEHKLQNPENKREIKADTSLKKLLDITDKDILTYFNLQKYLKVHFPKPIVPEETK
jgi:chromatin remodeling complex protein RSC6